MEFLPYRLPINVLAVRNIGDYMGENLRSSIFPDIKINCMGVNGWGISDRRIFFTLRLAMVNNPKNVW